MNIFLNDLFLLHLTLFVSRVTLCARATFICFILH